MRVALLVAAIVAVLAFIGGVVRDLPRRSGRKVAAILIATLAVTVSVAALRLRSDGSELYSSVLCLFGSFVVVTGGHVLRAVEPAVFDIPAETKARYMRHTTRFQCAALALCFAILLPIGALQGWF
jgi:hypothetical protein